MIIFALGLIIGILLSVFCVIIILGFNTNSEQLRTLIKSKIPRKEVEFLDAGSAELDAMEELYKKYSEKGEDLPLE